MSSKPGPIMKINQAYGVNNPVAPIGGPEIDAMRKRLFDNISDLNGNKYRLHPDEYHQLLNYHHYALTILDNIKIVRHAEMSDPLNRNMEFTHHPHSNIDSLNPYEEKLKVVYRRDGKATIVDTSSPESQNRFKAEWEKQFDENVYNPPCYTIPPSNRWGLPQ
jgi:hypothetical protein